MQDTLYAFVMRGELTKIALLNAGVVSKHSSSELLAQEYIKSLSLDLLDDEHVNTAKQMSTVYTAIAKIATPAPSARDLSTTLPAV